MKAAAERTGCQLFFSKVVGSGNLEITTEAIE
jgi:hypothetical protein